nr:MAG TPA: hypothetical protein [Caudoviricetes sp.]
MQKIRIDFDNPGLPQHISAVENDSQSRFFQATLYENGKAYTAPEGATYSIMYRGFGPQNQGWYDTINDGAGKRAACAVSGNVVTCEIARQALQMPGHVSIVLCVTTGKGYMLKSWPIECDCKNDRYDSTAEIESFFYVTNVSNASWMQVIQAAEKLKNTIDPTLSLSGKAADAKATGDAVGELKEDVENLETIVDKYREKEISAQLFDREKCTIGFMNLNGEIYSGGSYDAYFYTDYIPVGNNVGRKIIISQNKSETDDGEYVQSEARYVIAFDSDGVPIGNLGGSNIGEYIVPDKVSKIRICIAGTKPIFWQAEYDLRSGVLQEYYSLSAEIKSFAIGKQKTYIRKYKTLQGSRMQKAGINIPNKKNDVISFFGEFEQFLGLNIGIGYKMFYGTWLSIGPSIVYLYSNSGTLVISKEHGLTFSKFISVTIARKNNKNQALIVITTASGTFSVQWDFQGCNGDVFVMPEYIMANCTLSYNIKDINADVFAFGDSYITLGDSARYPKYVLERGYSNIMMIGYGGISTKEMLPIFRRVLDIYKPKYIVWCLGMNDTSDGTTFPTDWKNGIDEVLSACNHNNIVPILATIPCVPSIDHTKKNAYIKNSGWRYIDFAKAVGAENAGSSWYNGMLSEDNVHPTALGAQALASRFMVDVPEAFEGS